MDQVGYAKTATRAPPPARPDRTVTVTGAGVVGRGSWAVDRGPVARGPRSVVWVWDWAGLGLAWLGLDWAWAWAQNPYLFTPNPFGFQSIGLPTELYIY